MSGTSHAQLDRLEDDDMSVITGVLWWQMVVENVDFCVVVVMMDKDGTNHVHLDSLEDEILNVVMEG